MLVIGYVLVGVVVKMFGLMLCRYLVKFVVVFDLFDCVMIVIGVVGRVVFELFFVIVGLF